MTARKLISSLAAIAVFLGGVTICLAVPPQPFLFKAKLIVDGTTLTGDQPYEIKITNTSGTEFTPVDTAGNVFGTPTDGRFSYNVPMYDAEQTGGAPWSGPGTPATGCIQIWQQGGSQLTVSYPAQGSCPTGSGAFTIGQPGESIRFGTSLGTTTYEFDTPITATTPANIAVSPTSKAYADTKTNASSSAQTFTVTNTGGSSLTVGTLSLSGANANQFSKSSDNCSGQVVAGGGSCTVQVTFSPTSTGAKSGTLNIPSDAPNNTNLTATLTGTDTEANISVDLSTKNYGALNVGSTSAQTFTITNSGTASLVIGTVAISGTNAAEFVKGTDTCNGQTVAASATCTIQVTFTPASAGSKSATLSIPSDDPDTASLSVTLSGTVASQNLSIAPTSNAFSSVNVGSSSSAQTFTVTNTGNISLSIGTIAISGTNASEFTKQSDNCDSATVTPGGTCTLQVTFSPTSQGSKSATLSIPSNDPDGTTNVALTGTGLANEVNVSPTSLAFGNVVIGQTRNLDITVTNQGNADLTISSVDLAGSGFSLIQTIANNTVISGGGNATITARLTSSAETSYTGAVTINSNDTDEPTVTVTLSGAGVTTPTAHITIAPSGTISFGNNDIDETSDNTTNTITVTSDGSLDLTIGTVALSDTTNYTKTADTCSGATVPYSGSGTCQITVKFNPTTVGTKAATVTIPSNNGNIDATVDQSSTKNLTGVGIQYGLTVTPSTLNFGTVLLPDNSASGAGATCSDKGNGTVDCAVTIQNTGTQALTSFTLSTTNGSQFTVTPTTIGSMAGGAGTTAMVTYQSAAAASAHTGTLTVTSGSYTREVALSGTTNTKPATPTNSSPVNSATNTSVTPTLTAGAFSDADSDTHASSTWQVASAAGFSASAVVFQSINDTSNLTSITIPPGALQQNTTYYWRVSYKDSRGSPSTASTGFSFTTLSVTMNNSNTTPDATTVKSGNGTEITTISSANLPSSVANVSPQLLSDYSAVNSGTTANTSTDSVAIVKAKGGIDKDVLGIVTPAGTKIETVSTTTTSDTAFTTAPPTTFTFPYGVVSFRITDVTVGASVNVTIYTPSDLPSDAVWYKYNATNGWLKINSTGTYNAANTLLSSSTTFNVVSGKGVLTIKDDDVADVSSEVISGKAVIVDPGAPGIPVPEPVVSAAAATDASSGGAGCFIATAAFGSYFDPYVTILRNFRDGFLLTNRAGQAFVEWYYRVSPPIADYISGSEPLKAGVRIILLPAVGFSALSLQLGPLMTLFFFLAVMCGIAIALRTCWKYVSKQE
jgi:hypothetical protein